MIAVSYYDGQTRMGLLVWTHDADGRAIAAGGMDSPAGYTPVSPVTVVTTDGGDKVLEGWAHPDQLALDRREIAPV